MSVGEDLHAWVASASRADGRPCEWRRSGYGPDVYEHALLRIPLFRLVDGVQHKIRTFVWLRLCDLPSTRVVFEPILPACKDHRYLHLCDHHAQLWCQMVAPWVEEVRQYPVLMILATPDTST